MPKLNAAKPAAPAARKPAARRTAAKPAEEPTHVPQDSDNETAVPPEEQDWSTEPDYAKAPGDFDFDNLDDQDELVRVLYYGPEGTAKTTNAMDMVNMAPEGNVLVVNAEGGLRQTALRNRGIDTSRIKVWPKKGEPLTFEGLERLYYRVAADLEEDPLSWVGWVWDSDTAIYQAMLDTLIDANRRKAEEILKRAGKGRSGRAGNITLPDRFEGDQSDYYNKMSQQFRLLLRKWRSLDCHFAMTALLRRDEDKRTKKVQYGPAVSPAISTDVRAYVDVVVRTATANLPAGPVWWGRTHGTEDEAGKDRLGVLPHRMIEPTMFRIQGYLLGILTEADDPLQVQYAELVEQFEEQEAKADAPKTAKPPRKAAAKKPAAEPADTQEEADRQAEAGAEANAPDSDEAQARPAPEAPKRTARASRRAPTKPAVTKEESEARPVTRRSATRKADPKQTAARAAVKEETEKPKSGPATARIRAKVRTAQKQPGFKESGDKPPF